MKTMPEQTDEPVTKLYYDLLSVARRISQKIHLVNEHDKNTFLAHIIKKNAYTNVIIISKTKRNADTIGQYLQSQDIKALAVHGNKSAKECTEGIKAFNDNEVDVLITTDMILVSQEFTTVNQLISYNIPIDVTHYYSRLVVVKEMGEGIALVSEDEEYLMDAIQFAMKVEILQEDVEDFTHTEGVQEERVIKDKTKKPRHKKNKSKKEKPTQENKS